jgi:hypothetical protein
MEWAPLRPVASRPLEPVEPAEAARHVAALGAGLSDRQAQALALVTLAGRSRAEAARELGLSAEELGPTLVAARKALRRSVRPLPASGWCERAEESISDRLDGVLEERHASRLDVHLRNCPRCVEHERRLVHAQDELVAAFRQGHPVTTAPAPELELVPPPHEPAAPPVGRVVPAFLGWYVLIALGALLMLVSVSLALAGVEV